MAKILKPQQISLTSSTVSGSTYTEWSASHGTYTVGTYVKITDATTGAETEFECLVEHTASTDYYPPDDTTRWLALGASNKWKMFDDFINTQTEDTSDIVVVFTGESYTDTIALFDIDAESITIECTSSSVSIFDETYDLTGDEFDILDGYTYCFTGFQYFIDKVVAIPGLYPSLIFTVTIHVSTGIPTVKIGHLLVGRKLDLGETQYSPAVGIEDYSAKTINDFGETYLNQRAYAKTANVDVLVENANFSRVVDILADARSTPCLWELNNDGTDYEPLIIYGFYRDFSVLLESFNHSLCSLEIEGMI